jgi:hypothetical protein
MQPATACARFSDLDTLCKVDISRAIYEHGEKFGLPEGFAWGCMVPGSDVHMLASTRVYGANPAPSAGHHGYSQARVAAKQAFPAGAPVAHRPALIASCQMRLSTNGG